MNLILGKLDFLFLMLPFFIPRNYYYNAEKKNCCDNEFSFLRKGDFEIVISDYNRAKALFQNSEVKSFQKGKEVFV